MRSKLAFPFNENLIDTKLSIGIPKLFVTLLLLATIASFLWAGLAPLDQVVRGYGQIIPAEHSQIVQSSDGGILEKILVHEGDIVKQGDLLIQLQNSQITTSHEQVESKIKYLTSKIALLKAEESRTNIGYYSNTEINAKSNNLLEEVQLIARRNEYTSNIAVLQAQISQKEAAIHELDIKIQSLLSELKIAEQQQLIIVNLVNKSAASSMELLNANSRVQQFTSQIQNTRAALGSLQGGLAETKARIGEYKSHYESNILNEISQSELELDQAKSLLGNTQSQEAHTSIRSPVNGIVNHLYVNSINAVIAPAERLIQLTPTGDEVLVEGRINPNDRGNLHTGLRTRIRLNAYEGDGRNGLIGMLDEISSDSLIDEKGNPYYKVLVRISSDEVRTYKHHIIPGMVGSLDIIVGSRTLLKYLVSPIYKFGSTAFQDAK